MYLHVKYLHTIFVSKMYKRNSNDTPDAKVK